MNVGQIERAQLADLRQHVAKRFHNDGPSLGIELYAEDVRPRVERGSVVHVFERVDAGRE
jgi:hypothetical protein